MGTAAAVADEQRGNSRARTPVLGGRGRRRCRLCSSSRRRWPSLGVVQTLRSMPSSCVPMAPAISDKSITPLGALYELLLDLFEGEELRRWLLFGPDADIIHELPGGGATNASIVKTTIEALKRRGRIDAGFFARLTWVRDRRRDAIAAVAALWVEAEVDEPGSSRTPTFGPSTPALRAGDLLGGRYRLIADVGRARGGQVWRAIDLNGETVAVKVLNPDGKEPDPLRRTRFFRSAQAAAKVRHPAMVRIRDPHPDPEYRFGKYDFYVMDFIDAPNLDTTLAGAPLSDSETVQILLAIGEGVAAAHEQGAVHRDLKPSNILHDTGSGQVFIVDFDNAIRLADLTIVRSEMGLAGAYYSAPEVLMSLDPPAGGAPPPDERADVYSLAAIGVFARTGRHPPHFHVSGAIEMIECSRELKEVLSKACAYSSRDRYSSMVEMLAVLRSLSVGRLAGSLQLPKSSESAMEQRSRSRRQFSIAGCILSVALVAVFNLPDSNSGSAAKSRLIKWALDSADARNEALRAVGMGTPGGPPHSKTKEHEIAPCGGYDQVRNGSTCVARCPSGMRLIRGTYDYVFIREGERRNVHDFCIGLREVSVGEFRQRSSVESYETAKTLLWPKVKRSEYRQWDRGCNAGHTDRDNHPVNCVNWAQAADYCQSTGSRLPTEWEWEWAARGRDEAREYPWGDAIPDCERAIFSPGLVDGCGRDGTWAVGSLVGGSSDSRDGLQDMSGNVWEWTGSFHGKQTGSSSPRVLRGGGWNNADMGYLTTIFRGKSDASARHLDGGFRCAKDAL